MDYFYLQEKQSLKNVIKEKGKEIWNVERITGRWQTLIKMKNESSFVESGKNLRWKLKVFTRHLVGLLFLSGEQTAEFQFLFLYFQMKWWAGLLRETPQSRLTKTKVEPSIMIQGWCEYIYVKIITFWKYLPQIQVLLGF